MSTKLPKVVKSVRSYFFSEDTDLVGHGYSRKRRTHLEHFDDASTEGSNSIELEADAFSRMQRLRILQLSYVRFTGFYSLFPRSLRLLCWSGFHMKTIPEDLPLESLVALEMKKSHLEKAWEGIKILRSLKILNFSHSYFLKITPDFSGLPHLKTLILKDCIKLVKIHESIGCLDGLVYLNLRDCKNLRKLPGSFCKLKSLEKLIISGCCRLVTSAIELSKLESLTTLQADGMNFGNVNSWRVLWQTWSSKLRRSPDSNQFSLSCLSSSLVSLSLAKCNLTDDALSFGLCNLPSLCFLNLSENLIYNLPQSIQNLGMLRDLWLDGCLSLRSLPELPPSLVTLKAVRCSSLETVTNLPNLMSTLFLDVWESENLSEISGIFKLKPIDNFEVEILDTLGLLLKLDNTLDTVVEIFNRFTNTKRIYSVQQGLYEFGIFSTYFPGNEVPSWFNYKSEQSLLTLKVDSVPYINVTGLIICVVYARSSPRKFRYFGDSNFVGGHTFYIKVQNITKGLKWIYAPSFIGIPGENNRFTFLCHWKFGKYLQTGDQINVSLPCWSNTFKMKEFGVTPAYNKPVLYQSSVSTSEAILRHTPISDYQSEESVMEGYMPSYQLAVHRYYLSHPDYYVIRDNADLVVRSVLNEKLFEDDYVRTADIQASGAGDFDVEEDICRDYHQVFRTLVQYYLHNRESPGNCRSTYQGGGYEFGVFSTSLPKIGMPPWFAYRSIGNSIRFNVPSMPDLHIHSITWLSHWKKGQYLDRGDKVKISVALMYELQLEKFGVQIVYEDDEEDSRQVSAYQSQHHLINGVDISALQVARGSYFLCYHDIDIYQENSKNDGWSTNGWLDFLFMDSEEDINTDAATSDSMLKQGDDKMFP
ncbi:hypothetical protein RND71_041299 [Anisodus tanguticus]|uniref:C-JID domain-containing protein n=1 Tax=Anisodus tanguticus TaxID=243964 RepID=A0AAE1QX26_9SOLA|nr:hypothetical protein RND71_041299 [Anisodus tanguticus]